MNVPLDLVQFMYCESLYCPEGEERPSHNSACESMVRNSVFIHSNESHCNSHSIFCVVLLLISLGEKVPDLNVLVLYV